MTTLLAPRRAASSEGRAVPAPSSMVVRLVISKSAKGGPRGLFKAGGGDAVGDSDNVGDDERGGEARLRARVPASTNSASSKDAFQR